MPVIDTLVDSICILIVSDDEYFFADPECKLSKYSPKSWKSSSTHVSVKRGGNYFLLNTMYLFVLNSNEFPSLRTSCAHRGYWKKRKRKRKENNIYNDDIYVMEHFKHV